MNSGSVNGALGLSGRTDATHTRRSGDAKGNPRTTPPLTTANPAAVAPTASASVDRTVSAKPGCRRSCRIAMRRSFNRFDVFNMFSRSTTACQRLEGVRVAYGARQLRHDPSSHWHGIHRRTSICDADPSKSAIRRLPACATVEAATYWRHMPSTTPRTTRRIVVLVVPPVDELDL